jgi:hypothetical protein
MSQPFWLGRHVEGRKVPSGEERCVPAEDENEVEGCAADIECMAFDQANAGNPPPTAAGHAAEGIRFESHATGRNSREPTDPPGTSGSTINRPRGAGGFSAT